MVDNYARATELVDIAQNSAGASAAQFDKRLDSLQSKINKIKAGFENLVGSIANETSAASIFVTAIGNIMQVINNFNEGGLVQFAAVGTALFLTIKNVVNTLTNGLQSGLNLIDAFKAKVSQPMAVTINANDTNAQQQLNKLIERAQQGAKFTVTIDINDSDMVRLEKEIAELRSLVGGGNVNLLRGGEGGGSGTGSGNVNPSNITKNLKQQAVANTFGQLAQSAGTLVGSFITLAAATESAVAAQGAMTGQMIGQGTSSILSTVGMALMSSHPVAAAITMSVGGLASILGPLIGKWRSIDRDEKKYGIASESNLKELKEQKNKATENLSQIRSENESLYELGEEYENLASKTNLTIEESERLKEISQELQTTYGDLNGALTAEGNLYKENIKTLKEYINEKKREELNANLGVNITTFAEDYANAVKEQKDAINSITAKAATNNPQETGEIRASKKTTLTTYGFTDDYIQSLLLRHGDDWNELIGTYENLVQEQNNLIDSMKSKNGVATTTTWTNANNKLTEYNTTLIALKEIRKEYEKVDKTVEDLSQNLIFQTLTGLEYTVPDLQEWVYDADSVVKAVIEGQNDQKVQSALGKYLSTINDVDATEEEEAEATQALIDAYQGAVENAAEFLNKYSEDDINLINTILGLGTIGGEDYIIKLLESNGFDASVINNFSEEYIANLQKAYGGLAQIMGTESADFWNNLSAQEAARFANFAIGLSDETPEVQRQFAEIYKGILSGIEGGEYSDVIIEDFFEIFSKVDPHNSSSISQFLVSLKTLFGESGPEVAKEFWDAFSQVNQSGYVFDEIITKLENGINSVKDYNDILSSNLADGFDVEDFQTIAELIENSSNINIDDLGFYTQGGKIFVQNQDKLNELLEEELENKKAIYEADAKTQSAMVEQARIAYELEPTEENLVKLKQEESKLEGIILNYESLVLNETVKNNKTLNERLRAYRQLLESIDRYYNINVKLNNLKHDMELAELNYEVNNDFGSLWEQYSNLFEEEGLRKGFSEILKSELSSIEDIITNNDLYSKYFSIDKEGLLQLNLEEWNKLSDQYNKASDDQREIIKTQIDDLEDVKKAWEEQKNLIDENEKELLELTKAQKEFREEQEKLVGDTLDKISEAINKQEQQEIDAVKEKYDKIKQQDSDYLDSVRKNIEKERRLRSQTNQQEEIQDITNRIALLSMDTSGMYDAEILQLQKQRESLLESYADSQVDSMLDSMEEEIGANHNRMDSEVEFLEERKKLREEDWEYYRDLAKKYFDIYLIDTENGIKPIIELFATTDDEFKKSSEENQKLIKESWTEELKGAKDASELLTKEIPVQGKLAQEWYSGVNSLLEKWKTTLTNISEIGDIETKISVDDSELQKALDEAKQLISLTALNNAIQNEEKAKEEFKALIAENPQMSKADLARTLEFENYDKAKAYSNELFEVHMANMGINKNSDEYNKQKNEYFAASRENAWSGWYDWYQDYESIGPTRLLNFKRAGSSGQREINQDELVESIIDPSGQIMYRISGTPYWVKDSTLKNGKVSPYTSLYEKRYARGGLVDYTGPAWVDGTKSKPEAFLSASDTMLFAQLRDNLNRYSSYDFMNNHVNSSSYENNGVTNYDVHIIVERIANDYDVDQMWNQLQRKIVQSSNQITRAIRQR